MKKASTSQNCPNCMVKDFVILDYNSKDGGVEFEAKCNQCGTMFFYFKNIDDF